VNGAADAASLGLSDPRKLAAAGATASGSGNANALAMQNLSKATSVEGKTFNNAHARVISELGVRVQRATADSKSSGNVAALSKEQLGSETGVNLEEEAAKLLQFQQSYQAAAKMLQVAQSVFDTLLEVTGH
jgi:flagellar hook-associated protein 1 FlgK